MRAGCVPDPARTGPGAARAGPGPHLSPRPPGGSAAAALAGQASLPPAQFRLLGPLEVHRPGTGAALPGLEPLTRRVLAVLLLHAGSPCPTALLGEALWGAAQPPFAASTIRTAMYRLRRALPGPGGRITSDSRGYLLRAAPGDIDAGQLTILAGRGREAWYRGDLPAAAALLGQAARLWREPALADVPRAASIGPLCTRLTREYLDVRDLWIDALLGCGGGPGAIPLLRRILAADPLREHTWAQLVVAFHQAGDQDSAFGALTAAWAAIGRAYRREPGPELAVLSRRIAAAGRSAQ